MKKTILTKNEKKVLYGLIKYPEINDSELSKKINVKLSTLTSIKRKLEKNGFFRILIVPLLNRLDCELLAVIYTQFNPVIPLEDRIQTTKRTIEVFDEIFFSTGEQEKGFSLSLSKNYTNIGRINEIRTEIFGQLGLLEKEYPNEVIFSFETSKIYRFFDFERILKNFFLIEDKKKETNTKWFEKTDQINLSNKEKKVLIALIENPNLTTQKIGEKIKLSRHTIARMKKQFFEKGLIRQIVIPDLNKLGFEILAFYHIKFNPYKPPKLEDIIFLDSYYSIFFAQRKFETVIISTYPNFQEFHEDKMNKIRFLKENNLVSFSPLIETYSFEKMIVIKDFNFVPITKKILKV